MTSRIAYGTVGSKKKDKCLFLVPGKFRMITLVNTVHKYEFSRSKKRKETARGQSILSYREKNVALAATKEVKNKSVKFVLRFESGNLGVMILEGDHSDGKDSELQSK